MAAAIRSHQPEDFEALYQLDQECYPQGIAYPRRELRWYLRLPGADCLVAEGGAEGGAEDGAGGGAAIAGFVITERESDLGHIITLDVAAAQRRRGIGTALLAAAEARMFEAGVRQVSLETATNNMPAVAFWQKHGYRTVAVLKNYYLEKLDAYQMSKTLSRPAARKPRE